MTKLCDSFFALSFCIFRQETYVISCGCSFYKEMTLSFCALWCRDVSVTDALGFAGLALPKLVLSKSREFTFAYYCSLSDCTMYIQYLEKGI